MKYSKKIDLLKNRFKTSFKFVGFFMNDILLIIISTIILLIFLFTIRQSDLLYNIIKSILLLSFVVNIWCYIDNKFIYKSLNKEPKGFVLLILLGLCFCFKSYVNSII